MDKTQNLAFMLYDMQGGMTLTTGRVPLSVEKELVWSGFR